MSLSETMVADLRCFITDCGGETVTVGSTQLDVVIDWETVLDERGLQVRTGRRQALAVTDDLPTLTRRSSTLTRGSTTYRIEDYERDDNGGTRLILGEVET